MPSEPGLTTLFSTYTHMYFITALTQPGHSAETGTARCRQGALPHPVTYKEFSNLPLLKQKPVNAPYCIFYLNKKNSSRCCLLLGARDGGGGEVIGESWSPGNWGVEGRGHGPEGTCGPLCMCKPIPARAWSCVLCIEVCTGDVQGLAIDTGVQAIMDW